MKRFLFILTVFIIPGVPARSQSDLPEEIRQYYQEKNLVCTYSLRSEREWINILLMKEELKEIKDERLRRIADIMVAFSDKYRTIFSSNKNLGVPYELLSSDIYMIHEWIQNRNRITVSVNSFVIDQEVNKRFIASYKNNQPPVKIDVMKLDFLGYGGRIIHEWYYRDNEWKKNSPNLILVK